MIAALLPDVARGEKDCLQSTFSTKFMAGIILDTQYLRLHPWYTMNISGVHDTQFLHPVSMHDTQYVCLVSKIHSA